MLSQCQCCANLLTNVSMFRQCQCCTNLLTKVSMFRQCQCCTNLLTNVNNFSAAPTSALFKQCQCGVVPTCSQRSACSNNLSFAPVCSLVSMFQTMLVFRRFAQKAACSDYFSVAPICSQRKVSTVNTILLLRCTNLLTKGISVQGISVLHRLAHKGQHVQTLSV